MSSQRAAAYSSHLQFVKVRPGGKPSCTSLKRQPVERVRRLASFTGAGEYLELTQRQIVADDKLVISRISGSRIVLSMFCIINSFLKVACSHKSCRKWILFATIRGDAEEEALPRVSLILSGVSATSAGRFLFSQTLHSLPASPYGVRTMKSIDCIGYLLSNPVPGLTDEWLTG